MAQNTLPSFYRKTAWASNLASLNSLNNREFITSNDGSVLRNMQLQAINFGYRNVSSVNSGSSSSISFSIIRSSSSSEIIDNVGIGIINNSSNSNIISSSNNSNISFSNVSINNVINNNVGDINGPKSGADSEVSGII